MLRRSVFKKLMKLKGVKLCQTGSELLPLPLLIVRSVSGRLNLVDLAGSERIGKSGAEGSRLREAQCINKSLSALGDVISALRSRQAHVPFRNSRLTYLLQDSLSGDSKTLMMVQVSPVEVLVSPPRSLLTPAVFAGISVAQQHERVRVFAEVCSASAQRRAQLLVFIIQETRELVHLIFTHPQQHGGKPKPHPPEGVSH